MTRRGGGQARRFSLPPRPNMSTRDPGTDRLSFDTVHRLVQSAGARPPPYERFNPPYRFFSEFRKAPKYLAMHRISVNKGTFSFIRVKISIFNKSICALVVTSKYSRTRN